MEVPAPVAGVVGEISVSRWATRSSEGDRDPDARWPARRAAARVRARRRPALPRRRGRTPAPAGRRPRSRRPTPASARGRAGTRPPAAPAGGRGDGSRRRRPTPARRVRALRARARRRPGRGDRHRAQGPHHQGGRAGRSVEGRRRGAGRRSRRAGAGRGPRPARDPGRRSTSPSSARSRREPLSRIKRISGPCLHRNWVNDPARHPHDEADITELEAFRKELDTAAKRDRGRTASRCCRSWSRPASRRCRRSPSSTPRSTRTSDALILKRYYNIGFAADTPGRAGGAGDQDVDRKGILEIARELGRALGQRRARASSAPADMQGGTFTISEPRRHRRHRASRRSSTRPRWRSSASSRSSMKPVWNGAEFVPRLMLPLSLSYDHRVIDGAAGRALHARHLGRRAARATCAGCCCEERAWRAGDQGPRHRRLQRRPGHRGPRRSRATRSRRKTRWSRWSRDKATMDVPSPAAGDGHASCGSRWATRSPRARVILVMRGRNGAAARRAGHAAPKPAGHRGRAAAAGSRGAGSAAGRRAPERRHPRRGRRARRRPRRLHRRLPRRRPRHEGRAGRAPRRASAASASTSAASRPRRCCTPPR